MIGTCEQEAIQGTGQENERKEHLLMSITQEMFAWGGRGMALSDVTVLILFSRGI